MGDPKLNSHKSQLPFADTWDPRVHATQLPRCQSSALPPAGDPPVCEVNGNHISVNYCLPLHSVWLTYGGWVGMLEFHLTATRIQALAGEIWQSGLSILVVWQRASWIAELKDRASDPND